MSGLLVSFGDALLGQRPAQPGMLVLHVPSPLLHLGILLARTPGSAWQ
jgi:hypothetical protein